MTPRHGRRLMAVLAHPDNESLGVEGTVAKYASEGAEVVVLTATRGDSGRFRGHGCGEPEHPGPEALAKIREAELRAAGGRQSFYRAFSLVNGGRARETDLFEGLG